MIISQCTLILIINKLYKDCCMQIYVCKTEATNMWGASLIELFVLLIESITR